jgi:hypothetical protein
MPDEIPPPPRPDAGRAPGTSRVQQLLDDLARVSQRPEPEAPDLPSARPRVAAEPANSVGDLARQLELLRHQLDDAFDDLERRLEEAETRAGVAEARASVAEARVSVAERRAGEAERRAEEAHLRVDDLHTLVTGEAPPERPTLPPLAPPSDEPDDEPVPSGDSSPSAHLRDALERLRSRLDAP